ncbi:MAG: protein kinase, partial [Thermodesulfobacteriota bacterium]|nr:protein kinase [Thermodesulfobacteriota bacterium]
MPETPLVHYDIKPNNILFDGNDNAKLTDFGISRLLPRNPEIARLSRLVCTPPYAGPEQINGKIDPRSEIWSLGSVFYEMLTGKVCFATEKDDTSTTIINRIIKKEFIPIYEVAPDIPEPMADLVMTMLRSGKGNDFCTMAEVVKRIEYLQDFLSGRVRDNFRKQHGKPTITAEKPEPEDEELEPGVEKPEPEVEKPEPEDEKPEPVDEELEPEDEELEPEDEELEPGVEPKPGAAPDPQVEPDPGAESKPGIATEAKSETALPKKNPKTNRRVLAAFSMVLFFILAGVIVTQTPSFNALKAFKLTDDPDPAPEITELSDDKAREVMKNAWKKLKTGQYQNALILYDRVNAGSRNTDLQSKAAYMAARALIDTIHANMSDKERQRIFHNIITRTRTFLETHGESATAPRLRLLLGESYLNIHQTKKASAQFKYIISHYPDNTDAVKNARLFLETTGSPSF